ncbi:MAG TPA: hypothetical protein VK327_18575 [Candidatus Paceibacterota bacterium]|nr:hypothetical protein [Candidatus Paceibacterota bacterium]
MNTWKVIFATLVIFVAGALTGGLLVPTFSRCQLSRASKTAGNAHTNSVTSTNGARDWKLPAPLMGPLRKDFVDRLQRELKINAAQRERIEKIICEGQEQTRKIWLGIEPDVFQVMVDTKEKIQAVLTPDQVERFEEFFKPKPHLPATNNPPVAVSATNAVPANP